MASAATGAIAVKQKLGRGSQPFVTLKHSSGAEADVGGGSTSAVHTEGSHVCSAPAADLPPRSDHHTDDQLQGGGLYFPLR